MIQLDDSDSKELHRHRDMYTSDDEENENGAYYDEKDYDSEDYE